MNTDLLRCWAEIDVDAILNNFESVRSYIPQNIKLMAVLKADAYGHGAVHIARLLEGKVDFYGVAMVDEAVELRRAGILTPILILGYTQPELFPILVKYDIRPSVFSLDDAVALSECAEKAKKNAICHVAIDTGMSRIGYHDTENSINEIVKISMLKNLVVEGIFSHFASADSEDKAYSESQRFRFESFVTRLSDAGVEIPMRHMYNSAATIRFEAAYEMMRDGIIIYGLRPSNDFDMGKIPALRPAMNLRACIGSVNTLEAGVSVSYGCTYTTERPTKVATVCAGYADGVPRVLSNKAYVLIHGKKAPILGRVCMDQLMVDVTDIPETARGDYATIFGKDGDAEILADDLAEIAGTIGYELVCGIAKRVPRVYMSHGCITDIHYGIPHEEI